jgi:hypothetical protein
MSSLGARSSTVLCYSSNQLRRTAAENICLLWRLKPASLDLRAYCTAATQQVQQHGFPLHAVLAFGLVPLWRSYWGVSVCCVALLRLVHHQGGINVPGDFFVQKARRRRDWHACDIGQFNVKLMYETQLAAVSRSRQPWQPRAHGMFIPSAACHRHSLKARCCGREQHWCHHTAQCGKSARLCAGIDSHAMPEAADNWLLHV